MSIRYYLHAKCFRTIHKYVDDIPGDQLRKTDSLEALIIIHEGENEIK